MNIPYINHLIIFIGNNIEFQYESSTATKAVQRAWQHCSTVPVQFGIGSHRLGVARNLHSTGRQQSVPRSWKQSETGNTGLPTILHVEAADQDPSFQRERRIKCSGSHIRLPTRETVSQGYSSQRGTSQVNSSQHAYKPSEWRKSWWPACRRAAVPKWQSSSSTSHKGELSHQINIFPTN